MTDDTGSDEPATDPAVNSQDSGGTPEFPPPSQKANLVIELEPDEKAEILQLTRLDQSFNNHLNGQA